MAVVPGPGDGGSRTAALPAGFAGERLAFTTACVALPLLALGAGAIAISAASRPAPWRTALAPVAGA